MNIPQHKLTFHKKKHKKTKNPAPIPSKVELYQFPYAFPTPKQINNKIKKGAWNTNINKKMYKNPQLQIAKVDLNLIVQPKCLISKKQTSYTSVSHRLRYCHINKQHKFKHERGKNSSFCFQDGKGARDGRDGSRLEFMTHRESNLLGKVEQKEKLYAQSQQQVVHNFKQNRGKSTHIINISSLDDQQPKNDQTNTIMNHKKQKNIKRSIDSTYLHRSTTQKSSPKKSSKPINPYTKQQYLYFRRKQRQDMKKNAQKMKKNNLQYNIMKPCQIFQKELNTRDHIKSLYCQSEVQKRPLTAKTKINTASFTRGMTPKISDSQCLRPWEQTLNGGQDQIFHF